MDLNNKPENQEQKEPLSTELFDRIRAKVRYCVDTVCDPNGPAIEKYCRGFGFDRDHISKVFSCMINSGELKQREDRHDHDWIYRRGVNWDNPPQAGEGNV